ncbi:hypothetical protein RJ641_000154 [Dillenia turbinata]|uniref:Uncharacterized protein n=1 Tax=Dillenia turbinata TaxID=194707 RepID=A0AAN8ZQS5_9MAGN
MALVPSGFMVMIGYNLFLPPHMYEHSQDESIDKRTALTAINTDSAVIYLCAMSLAPDSLIGSSSESIFLHSLMHGDTRSSIFVTKNSLVQSDPKFDNGGIHVFCSISKVLCRGQFAYEHTNHRYSSELCAEVYGTHF